MHILWMRWLVTVASGVLVLLVTGVYTVSMSAQGGKKTIWDGVYTSQQANRGQETYDKSCASCHQDDLSGGGDDYAANLRGADFFARWNGKTVAELFHAIADGMPKNAPGSLSPDAYTDVLSFLMKKNLVPAGDSALAQQTDVLERILITDKPR